MHNQYKKNKKKQKKLIQESKQKEKEILSLFCSLLRVFGAKKINDSTFETHDYVVRLTDKNEIIIETTSNTLNPLVLKQDYMVNIIKEELNKAVARTAMKERTQYNSSMLSYVQQNIK